jgi:hypothetical protein
MSDVTQILGQIEEANGGASDRLLPLVHEGLRRLAAIQIGGGRPGLTLQATALVHGAYVGCEQARSV